MKLYLFLLPILLKFSCNAQTAGGNLFDDHILHEIHLNNVDTNNLLNLESYQMINMIIDNNLVESVGIKQKGNISFYDNPNKLGIKVKTNKYVSNKEYDGIKEFSLNINFQDPSFMREKLMYDLCENLGLFSLRSSFAKVYINGVYWGVYTLVEGKDEMFKHEFDNRNMDAIESLDFGDMCFISQNPEDYNFEANGYNPTYFLENGDATTAWPKFAKMIDKANNSLSYFYMDTVSKYLNLEHFFKYQAANVYLLNFDSYIGFKGNQIYAFDTIYKLWQVIPWDFNASFGLWNTNNYNPSSYPIIPNSVNNGCITQKMNDVSELKQYYLSAMCELNQILSDTTSYFTKINSFRTLIQQAVYDDYRKHISNSDFDNALGYGYNSLFNENQPSLKSFIIERNHLIKTGLENLNFACSSLGINETDLSQIELVLLPNPVEDILRIKIDRDIDYTVEITDMYGKRQFYEPLPIEEINITFLNSGIYRLIINAENQNISKLFIKI